MPGKTTQAAVVDTSVFADYFFLYPRRPERHERARTVPDKLSSLGSPIYEPFLFETELRTVLVRRIKPEYTPEITGTTLGHVNVVEEKLTHDKAAETALPTGCRAVDAYYIATADHLNAIPITNDRAMKQNASKIGIETYYLLNNREALSS